jgi:hypothetical protein
MFFPKHGQQSIKITQYTSFGFRNHSAISFTLTDDDFCLLSAASAAEFSAEDVKCTSPYFRSSPIDLVYRGRKTYRPSEKRAKNQKDEKIDFGAY